MEASKITWVAGGRGVGSSWRRHQRGTGCSIRVRGDVNLDLDDVEKRMNMGSLQMLGNNFKTD